MSESAANGQATPGETTPAAPPQVAIPPVPPLPPASAAAAAPPYAAPQGYATPHGYSAPQGYLAPQNYAPPQAYAPPPQGYGPYAPPPQGYGPYAPPPQGYGPYAPPPALPRPSGGSGLGVVAFVLAVIAAVGATILGSIAGYNIGVGTARNFLVDAADIDFDWSILTPVRGWVLLGELSFWGGTILGIWALVQGIIAIVKNLRRGWGIAAVVIAVIGPIAFATGVQAFLAAGFASGASVGG